MDEFREEFLSEAISDLQDLRARITSSESIEILAREIFLLTHTLKGSSLIFDLHIPSRLAHEIENLIEAFGEGRVSNPEWIFGVLQESLKILEELFISAQKGEELNFPHDISSKLSFLVVKGEGDIEVSIPADFPGEMLSQLSRDEIRKLHYALINEKNIYLLEVGFARESFSEAFKELKRQLNLEGEVIASLAVSSFTSGSVGFRILLTSSLSPQMINAASAMAGGRLIYHYLSEKIAGPEDSGDGNKLEQAIARAIASGRQTARMLGKDVDFSHSAANIPLSDERLNLVSSVILHLIRNAIDHGIEGIDERHHAGKDSYGRISIEAKEAGDGIAILLKDDGRGIDTGKVYEKALRAGIISRDQDIGGPGLLDLIFEPGLSTSESLSEISGRGVGLDAVKTELKNIGGNIKVRSRNGAGTEFDIYIPLG